MIDGVALALAWRMAEGGLVDECPTCRSRTRRWRDKLWDDYLKAWTDCADTWHEEERDA